MSYGFSFADGIPKGATYQYLCSNKTLWNGATAVGTTVYHYDLAGRLLMEISSAGAVQA
jgi:hypothetical protein